MCIRDRLPCLAAGLDSGAEVPDVSGEIDEACAFYDLDRFEPLEFFRHRLDVRQELLEVIVTDLGRYVSHLTAQAFVLFDEVCPVTLSLIHISEPTRLGMISYAVF